MSATGEVDLVVFLEDLLGRPVVSVSGFSNSRFAAKFGRSLSSARGRLWDSQLGRACDVLGLDRSSGLLWLRYALSAPFRAVEVGVAPSSLSAGRWEPL